MSHLQDFSKVASGLVMVVKESLKTTPRLKTGDVGGTAMDILKAVTGTVTDFTGLTQGRLVRQQDLQSHHEEVSTQHQHYQQRHDTTSGTIDKSSRSDGSVEKSYLHKSLDSLGPRMRSSSSASGGITSSTTSSTGEEVLSKVQEKLHGTLPKTPISKPLEKFVPVSTSSVPDSKPSSDDRLEETAIKAEQVLQSSDKGRCMSFAVYIDSKQCILVMMMYVMINC
jgi:hypothetical protein